MKLLIKVFLSLLVLVAALVAIAFYTLPKHSEVKMSIYIEATPEQVYPFINNPTKWEHWSAWNKTYDPTIIHMYGGPWAGTGASHRWSGDKIGNSLILFTESVSPALLQYEQTSDNSPYKITGSFELEEVAGRTRVVWQQVTQFENTPIAVLVGNWRKQKTERELTQGLRGLQLLVEKSTTKSAAK